jgi:TonB family protein
MAGAPLKAAAGAGVPDPRFYQARELDRYPAPLAPLNLQAAAGLSGSVRLWLSIDLTGNVVDVSVADADPSGALESRARESLLATRFMPAMKNERPVKSRILLELRYGR